MLQPHHQPEFLRSLQAERIADADRRRTVAAARPANVEASVRQLTGMIRKIARGYRLPANDVDDVVQTAWVRLLEHADRIREPAAVPAWLQTTAQNESLRTLRNSSRTRPTEGGVIERQLPHVDDTDELDAAERCEALIAAVHALPPRHRALAQMMLDDPEISYAKIAERLDIPVGSVGPTRARCLKRLGMDPRVQRLAA